MKIPFISSISRGTIAKDGDRRAVSEVKEALNKLGRKISDDEMREMNFQVNVKGKRAEEVAKDYLIKEELLKK
jgi:glycine betaine/choline ABC-type transport system substrate-binding protein